MRLFLGFIGFESRLHSETLVFVLTNSERNRQYGFCRRFLTRDKAAARLPVCLCILTRWYAVVYE
jgi:hypothetical protein